MAKNYNWRIKREYYNLINKGIKTLEVRVGYPDIKRVREGDTITFNDYSNIKFEVVRITCYEDFREMLNNEDSSKAIPGVTLFSLKAIIIISLAVLVLMVVLTFLYPYWTIRYIILIGIIIVAYYHRSYLKELLSVARKKV